MTVFKLFFGEETRRFNVDYDLLSFADFLSKIAEIYQLDSNLIVVKYVDEEGDRVTISCDEDLEDAIEFHNKKGDKCVKIHVSLSSMPVRKSDDLSSKDDLVVLRVPKPEDEKVPGSSEPEFYPEDGEKEIDMNKSVQIEVPVPKTELPKTGKIESLPPLAPLDAASWYPSLPKKPEEPKVPVLDLTAKPVAPLPPKPEPVKPEEPKDASYMSKFVSDLIKSGIVDSSKLSEFESLFGNFTKTFATPSPAPAAVPSPLSPEVKEDDAKSAHVGVICDGCGASPITGPRYKCTVCPNFDLCAVCEAGGVHDAGHPLLKMKKPKTAFGSWRRDGLPAAPEEDKKPSGRARYHAKYVTDLTIDDRTFLTPGTFREKVWKLQNNGKIAWPAGFKIIQISGDEVVADASSIAKLPEVAPGAEVEVKVTLKVPEKPGRYTAYFRLTNLDGDRFGPRFWADFIVPTVDELKSDKPVVAPAPAEPTPAVPVAPVPESEKYKDQLKELAGMGFSDAALNVFLLEKFEGSVSRVVNWLLDGNHKV